VDFIPYTMNGTYSNYRPSKSQSDKTSLIFRSYLESVQVNETWPTTD